jgi:hypothetical protein
MRSICWSVSSRIFLTPLQELLAHVLPRDANAGTNGALGNAEDRGRVVDRVTGVKVQNNRRTLWWRQPLQSYADSGELVRSVAGLRVLDLMQLNDIAPRSDEASGLANDDAIEPRTQPCGVRQRAALAPCSLESGLDRILGVTAGPAQEDRKPDQSRVVLVHEPGELVVQLAGHGRISAGG